MAAKIVAMFAYLSTLLVFPGVSKFFIKSPGLPVRAPNLPANTYRGHFQNFFINFIISETSKMKIKQELDLVLLFELFLIGRHSYNAKISRRLQIFVLRGIGRYMFGDVTGFQQCHNPWLRYTSSCWEDKTLSSASKIFSKYCNISKTQFRERFLEEQWGMTWHLICQRVNM